MAPDPRQRVRRRSLLTWLFALVVPSLAAAQTGTITGKVTDESGGAPLEASRVILTGTTRIETTNREGGYTFREVQPGTYQVRVLRVGYRPATDSVTVADGATATADFAMAAAPVQLDEIVTTATGEQRKLEVGNVVTTIDASKVAETAPITEFSNLLSGRAAGVQVLKSSGTTGEGTRIRIRGSNSISLSNEPLYYLDGVRLESAASSTTLNVGGFSDQSSNQGPSRINDIDPDDIESIEIVKGPAAATLYGIQASNGVVRITTKHGTAGPPRWNLFSELGSVSDNNQYPVNYYGRVDSGYSKIQGTKPQTIGYPLDDSPAGLAAWIVEKFRTWSDCDGDVERRFTKDQLLDNIMLYWLTATAHSAGRLYYEAAQTSGFVPDQKVEVPIGFAAFPKEIIRSPRHWAEQRYDIRQWTEMPRGGHFAAFEEGDLLVGDVREFFRPLRVPA